MLVIKIKEEFMRRLSLFFVLFVVVMCFSVSVRAELIQIGFVAKVRSVQDPQGNLDGKISTNDLMVGVYTYESTTTDSNPLPGVGDYNYYSSLYGIRISADGFTFQTDPTNVNFLIELCNNLYGGDYYLLRSYVNLPLSNGIAVEHISWQLDDPQAMALSSTALLTVPPDLSAFQSIWGLSITGDKYSNYEIIADVTSAYIIPEPISLGLLVLGGLFLRRKSC
jgi:hypothetical protein